MRVLYAKFHKYLRLSLSDITTFEIHCDNPEQVIIGTNGSGKSSIMQELTPIPAHRRSFGKGGYKIIYIRHRGMLYKLVSDFKSGNNHEFWIANDDNNYEAADYENLNPGRTYKVQLSLVEEHFGFTIDLVNLFTSKEKFTTMSVARRKEWIIRLSGGDLDYVIGLHRTLVKRATESSTIVKHFRKRIAEESTKLMSQEEFDQLNGMVNEYQTRLTALYNAGVTNTSYDLDAIKTEMAKSMDSINTYTKYVSGKKLPVPRIDGVAVTDIDDLRRWKHTLTDRVGDYQNRLNQLYRDNSELSESVKRLVDSKDVDIQDVQNIVDRLTYENNTLLAGFIFGPFKDVNLDQAKALYNQLVDVIMGMLDNSTKVYTREMAEQTKVKRKELSDEYLLVSKELDKMNHKLSHINDAKSEECPKCNHRWYPGIQEGSKEYVLQQIGFLSNRVQELDKLLFETDEYLGLYTEFAKSANSLNSLILANPMYSTFWDFLLDNEIWYMHSNTLLRHVEMWWVDVNNSFIKDTNDETIALNKYIIAQHELSKDSDINKTELMLKDIEDGINTYLGLIETTNKSIQDLSEFESHYETTRLNYEQALKHVKSVSKQMSDYLEQVATDMVGSEINDYQFKLSNTQAALHSANSIQIIIDSLQKDLDQANLQMEVRDNLAKALDPRTGLIADYIRSFIDIFVSQLNDIISKVWTTPMVVMPCGFNEDGNDVGDLNYKFPVMHNNGLTTSADVADNSSAQTDMIDFAFVLSVYLYLGFENYPLYIDELAPTMDELHRININNFVKMLIESNRHSQMFMISHYQSGYGIFQNADICMLSDINIVNKPERYNTHVVIK